MPWSSGDDISISFQDFSGSNKMLISKPVTGGNRLALGSGTTEVLSVTSAGKVGIGISNPGAKLDVSGDFKRGEVYHTTISRSLTQNAGDYIEIGSFANNGYGFYAEFTVYAHSCGEIQMEKFKFMSTSYSSGVSGSWIELPLEGSNDLYGNAQAIAIDVMNPDRTTTASPVYARLRTKTAPCATMGVTVILSTNVAFTPTSVSGTGAVVQTGYLGSNKWQFPVSSTAWNNTSEGLFISSSGNVGIGNISPSAKFEVAGQVKITGGVPALGKVLTSDGVGLATWESFTSGGVGGWTDDGTAVRLTTISDYVGIGTATPGAPLQVNGEIVANGLFGAVSGAPDNTIWAVSKNTYPNWGIFYNEGTPDYIEFKTGGTLSSRIVLDDGSAHFGLNGGNVGIGTASPGYKLHVAGSMRWGGTGSSAPYVYSDEDASGIYMEQVGTTTANSRIRLQSSPSGSQSSYSQFFVDPVNGFSFMSSAGGNSGYVGIGTITPNANLHIYANAAGRSMIRAEATSENSYLVLDRTADNATIVNKNDGTLRINHSGSSADAHMVILTNGFVGIGTATPSQALHVVGSICYTGGIGACSDFRYKQNITPLSNSLSNILKIQGVNYFWRTEEFPKNKFNKEKQIGFIAQDLEKIYPEIILTDDKGYKSVDYSRLTPMLVEAIKELNSKNESQNASQEKLILQLKNTIDEMQKKIEKLEKK
ncbi:MAG: tail fiber domain-containing protein [Bacteroidota bacterium]